MCIPTCYHLFCTIISDRILKQKLDIIYLSVISILVFSYQIFSYELARILVVYIFLIKVIFRLLKFSENTTLMFFQFALHPPIVYIGVNTHVSQ